MSQRPLWSMPPISNSIPNGSHASNYENELDWLTQSHHLFNPNTNPNSVISEVVIQPIRKRPLKI
jgi:hypothetical protein